MKERRGRGLGRVHRSNALRCAASMLTARPRAGQTFLLSRSAWYASRCHHKKAKATWLVSTRCLYCVIQCRTVFLTIYYLYTWSTHHYQIYAWLGKYSQSVRLSSAYHTTPIWTRTNPSNVCSASASPNNARPAAITTTSFMTKPTDTVSDDVTATSSYSAQSRAHTMPPMLANVTQRTVTSRTICSDCAIHFTMPAPSSRTIAGASAATVSGAVHRMTWIADVDVRWCCCLDANDVDDGDEPRQLRSRVDNPLHLASPSSC